MTTKAKDKNRLEDYDKWFEYYFPNYAKVKCALFDSIRILTHGN